jgi:predicted ArsR family transcriptional regulator
MDRFDALGDAGLRAALLFVRGMPSPVTADDTAAALRIHRTVARSRLERLLRAGLLESRFARRSGRTGPGAGRPAKLYAPAAGRARRPLEFPPRRLTSLVGRLVEEIPLDRRREALRRAGEDYGREIARSAGVRATGDLAAGLEAVCAGLRSLGFPARLDRVDREGGVIETADCPLRPLVREHDDAGEIDHGMWAGLVEQGVTGLAAAHVRCTSGGCRRPSRPCRVTVALGPAG